MTSIQGWFIAQLMASSPCWVVASSRSMKNSRHSGQVPLRLPTATLLLPVPCALRTVLRIIVPRSVSSSAHAIAPMILVPGIQ